MLDDLFINNNAFKIKIININYSTYIGIYLLIANVFVNVYDL